LRFLFSAVLVVISFLGQTLVFADATRDRTVYTIMKQEEEKVLKDKALEKAFAEAQIKDLSDKVIEEQRNETPPVKFVFKYHPYFDSELVYDDNLFRSHDNQLSDWYNRLGLGVRLYLGAELGLLQDLNSGSVVELDKGAVSEFGFSGPGAKTSLPSLNFDLGLSMINYMKNTSLNQKPLSNFNGGFVPDLNFTYKLGRLRRKFKFRQTLHPDVESLSTIQVGGQGQLSYVSSITEIGWEDSGKSLGYNLGYQRTSTTYEDVYKNSDYLDQRLILLGFLQAFPKTRFFLESNFGMSEYTGAEDDSNDVNYWKALLGVKGKLFKKMIGSAKAGFQQRNYKSGNQLNGLNVQVNLDYDYSPKTKFGLLFSQDSSEGNYFADGFNQNYTASFGANYIFNNKLNANLGFLTYAHDKYQSGREDDTFRSSFSLNYVFRRWAKLKLSLTHIDRRSNEVEAAFVDNNCKLSLNMEF